MVRPLPELLYSQDRRPVFHCFVWAMNLEITLYLSTKLRICRAALPKHFYSIPVSGPSPPRDRQFSLRRRTFSGNTNGKNRRIQTQRLVLRSDARPLSWLLVFQACAHLIFYVNPKRGWNQELRLSATVRMFKNSFPVLSL